MSNAPNPATEATGLTDEQLFATLMADPNTAATARRLAEAFPRIYPEQPIDAAWLAVDAEAINRQGIEVGLVDTGRLDPNDSRFDDEVAAYTAALTP